MCNYSMFIEKCKGYHNYNPYRCINGVTVPASTDQQIIYYIFPWVKSSEFVKFNFDRVHSGV